MKTPPLKEISLLLFGVVFGVATPSDGQDAIRRFYDARKLDEAGDKLAAAAEYAESCDAAGEENLPYYVFAAAYFGSFHYGNQLEQEKARSLATRGLETFHREREKGTDFTRQEWSEGAAVGMMGTLERADYTEGKLGEGWARNRAAIALWKELTGQQAGEGFDAELIPTLSREMRAYGWRFCEREADYLHETGRSGEALALLDEVIPMARPDMRSSDPFLRNYAGRLLSKSAGILGFLSEEPEAIARYDELINEISRWGDSEVLFQAMFNRLFEIDDFLGLDDADYEEAKRLEERVRERGFSERLGLDRTMAKLESLRKSRGERHEMLERARQGDTSALEHFFSEREYLFELAESGASNLDSDYFALLEEVRRMGNKRAEPRIYRRYANWLLDQGRLDEAARYYNEALELSLAFGWVQWPPYYYESLGFVAMARGDEAGARLMWARADDYFRQHPEVLPHNRVRSLRDRLWALLRAGKVDEARALAGRVRAYAEGKAVDEGSLLDFTTDGFVALAKVLVEEGFPTEWREGENPDRSVLQPESVATVAEEGMPARAVVYLMNNGAASREGVLEVEAPSGVTGGVNEEGGLDLSIGGRGETKASIALELEPGSLREIFLESIGQPGEAALKWTSGDSEKSASWSFSWGEIAREDSVLEAVVLESNPFAGVPVLHHFALVDGSSPLVRLRSPHPVRIEYRDPESGRLLAVDANGNGDLSEAGDFVPPLSNGSPGRNGVEVGNDGKGGGKLECWLFGNERLGGAGFEIPVEILTPAGEWVETGMDQVRGKE